MSQGFYGFPNILGLLRATAFRAIGMPGATAGAGLAGGTTSGAPVAPAGPFDLGDVIVDQSGSLWICTTAGTSQSSPGSFTQIAAGFGDPTTTKGDLIVHGSSTTRLGVGSDNQVLTADSSQSLGVKWAVTAAGAGGALTQIAQTTLGSSAASIPFSSIPGSYSALRVVLVARGDTAAAQSNVRVQFNADTTAGHYTWEQFDFFGGASAEGTETASDSALTCGRVSAANAVASVAGCCVLEIPLYAGTTFFKVVQTHFSTHNGAAFTTASSHLAGLAAGWWNSTAAVTSLTLFPAAGSFVAGSQATLYGIS